MKQSTMGIVSLVLGLVSIIIFALPCGLAALVTGIIGVREENTAHGCAIAGIIIGGLATLFGAITILSAMSRF